MLRIVYNNRKQDKMKKYLLSFLLGAIFLLAPPSAYAQKTDETADQREAKFEDKMERLFKEPDTVDEVLKMLKERAEIKIKEKRREQLLKTKISASVLTGFETNPLNDENEKSDVFVEEDFSFNWLPTFNENFSADLGYRLANQSYSEQTDLSTFDHVFNASFKYYPFPDHLLLLQPGGEYEWLIYPLDETATYEDTKTFLKFKHYVGKEWHYGGKYEYSYKVYDKKFARDTTQQNIDGRTDSRNTVELYVTKYIGKLSAKLRGKIYRNDSNDLYQEYYDYDSYRGYFTLSGSFLKDNKLYVSFTPDFEVKSYDERVARDTNVARVDHVTQYKLDFYYTLAKNWELSYNFTNKLSSSNASGGEFDNMTNQIGVTLNF